jgi:predicted Fe-Mo cluster-binding NifX family protein
MKGGMVMSRTGFTLLRDNLDAPLSGHFGMAKWLLIYESDQAFQFERNEELYGSGVVGALVGAGCTDAVFANIGQGALAKLMTSHIRPWYGPPDVPVRELVERLKRGELKEATEATEGHQPQHRRRRR